MTMYECTHCGMTDSIQQDSCLGCGNGYRFKPSAIAPSTNTHPGDSPTLFHPNSTNAAVIPRDGRYVAPFTEDRPVLFSDSGQPVWTLPHPGEVYLVRLMEHVPGSGEHSPVLAPVAVYDGTAGAFARTTQLTSALSSILWHG